MSHSKSVKSVTEEPLKTIKTEPVIDQDTTYSLFLLYSIMPKVSRTAGNYFCEKGCRKLGFPTQKLRAGHFRRRHAKSIDDEEQDEDVLMEEVRK